MFKPLINSARDMFRPLTKDERDMFTGKGLITEDLDLKSVLEIKIDMNKDNEPDIKDFILAITKLNVDDSESLILFPKNPDKITGKLGRIIVNKDTYSFMNEIAHIMLYSVEQDVSGLDIDCGILSNDYNKQSAIDWYRTFKNARILSVGKGDDEKNVVDIIYNNNDNYVGDNVTEQMVHLFGAGKESVRDTIIKIKETLEEIDKGDDLVLNDSLPPLSEGRDEPAIENIVRNTCTVESDAVSIHDDDTTSEIVDEDSVIDKINVIDAGTDEVVTPTDYNVEGNDTVAMDEISLTDTDDSDETVYLGPQPVPPIPAVTFYHEDVNNFDLLKALTAIKSNWSGFGKGTHTIEDGIKYYESLSDMMHACSDIYNSDKIILNDEINNVSNCTITLLDIFKPFNVDFLLDNVCNNIVSYMDNKGYNFIEFDKLNKNETYKDKLEIYKDVISSYYHLVSFQGDDLDSDILDEDIDNLTIYTANITSYFLIMLWRTNKMYVLKMLEDLNNNVPMRG